MTATQPVLQAALLCHGMTTDEEGRHTFHREFSQYTMGYAQPFTVVTIWRGGDGTASQMYDETVEFIAPDGRVVASGRHGPFALRDATYRQVNSLLLENVDFTNEGTYTWSVTLSNQEGQTMRQQRFALAVV